MKRTAVITGCRRGSIDDAKSYALREAEDEMNNVLVHDELFPDDSLYIEAGADILDRDYDTAIKKLRRLGDYEGAKDLLLETKYRKAAMLADADSYEKSIALYNELSGYKDADELFMDTRFRKAC